MKAIALLLVLAYAGIASSSEVSKEVQTPYTEQKVVFDIYLDHPDKINSALFWIRSLVNPLMDEPYGLAPEFLDIKVVLHGTEIVTVARKNYGKYRDAVERMRYYASLGVEFKVCSLAASDYDYAADAFHEFVELRIFGFHPGEDGCNKVVYRLFPYSIQSILKIIQFFHPLLERSLPLETKTQSL